MAQEVTLMIASVGDSIVGDFGERVAQHDVGVPAIFLADQELVAEHAFVTHE